MKKTHRQRSLFAVLAALAAVPCAMAEGTYGAPDTAGASQWFSPFQSLASAQGSGAFGSNAANMAEGMARNNLVPAIWGDAPDWLKRTEWDIQFDSINGTEYHVLTTQPLWQSADRKHTFFTQLSYEHYNLHDIGRNTVNVGLGYRELFFDNKLLLGVNSFYDDDVSNSETRASVGADAKWGPLDFYTNYYFGLGGSRTVDGGLEKVDNGYDFELGAPVPYLPWARAYGRFYQWDNPDAPDITGGEFSGEFALTQNFTLVGGTRGGDNDKRENYVMVQFRFGDDGKATLLNTPVSSQAFEARNLADNMLDKIRRENRIIVQRVGGNGNVIIARGN